MDFSVKDVPPPVPLKTYQWEDLKRDKERGKYPYTYLHKNPLVEQDNMPLDDKKPLVAAESEEVVDAEQKKVEDGEEKKTKVVQGRKNDIYTTTEETDHRQSKDKTISDENARLTMRQDSTDDIEIKYELLVDDDSLDQTDRMSVSSKADSRNTESEDTSREKNINQYFDKEQSSKSILDSSGLEAVTSVSNAGFVPDCKDDVIASVSESLEVPQDHKRQHSGSSEGTKRNLSLFEKIKNFKPSMFVIPRFKKLTFHKTVSKRVKHDFREPKLTATKSEVPRTCESPVYIYIPLKPTAEDLEKERQEAMKSESHRRLASNSRTDRRKDSKATNGTVSSTTASTNVDAPSASSKWTGLQSKTDKTSPPVKKKSKVTNAKEASSVTTKRDDSPVEYIYIPLKPVDNETWTTPSSKTERSFDQVEAVNTKLISTQTQVPVVTQVDKAVVKEEEIIIETKEPEKPAIEIKQLPNVISKPDEASKKTSDDNGKNNNDKTTKLTQDIKKLVSKLKGEQTKCGDSRVKIDSKRASVEKKTSPTSKKDDDSPVEYIYIPLKGPLPDERPEQVEVKRKENISSEGKIQGVTVAIVEQEKPTVMNKFNSPATEQKSAPVIKNQFTGKKDSPLLPSVKRSDAPVEYIYIPLKPLESEISIGKADSTQIELQTTKEDSKREIEQTPKEALTKQVEGKVTKLEKVPAKPKVTQKDNIISKLKGLIPKMAQTPKPDVKTKKELVTEKVKSPPKNLNRSDAPVEYIYIPLKPPTSEKTEAKTEETINTEESMKVETVESATISDIVAQSPSLPVEEPKRRKIEDNSEEAQLIMAAVIKTWQGFKTKPLQKPMPLKRTDPKMSSPKTSIVFGSGESPVEYIYIPLNPTEEQLEYERMLKEQKRLTDPGASSAARTPERSVVAEDQSKRAAVKTGAIKKQPTAKGNKVKDTTTKLTEDIKKFASKLNNMQKKSKKPTYKTFKHGSKSSRMSPTTSKKPIDSRSPPILRQCEESPVEYIFIPLKDPETTEEALKEIEKNVHEAAISIPFETVEKVEETVKKSSILEEPYYELLTEEDEEDGLKTAITASLNKMKPGDEVIKTEDSPKSNRKLSTESIKMEEMENGVDKSQNEDENAVYEERIQVNDEEPDSSARKLVAVPSLAVDEEMIKDKSLEDEHNKWSKSTLLAVC